VRAPAFHGTDGLGDSNQPSPQLKVHQKSALDLLSEQLALSSKQGLSLIATGPLTNIAAFLTKDPDAARRINQLVIMGGAFGLTEYGHGNETPVAEFNIYSDPEVAKIVLESGIAVKAVGLDVTMSPEAHLDRNDYARLKSGNTALSRFTSQILARAMRKWGTFALHDPMAAATIVKPSLFRFEKHRVTVETKGEHTTGMTVTDRRDSIPNKQRAGNDVMICSRVRVRDFKSLVLGRILKR